MGAFNVQEIMENPCDCPKSNRAINWWETLLTLAMVFYGIRTIKNDWRSRMCFGIEDIFKMVLVLVPFFTDVIVTIAW